MAHNKSKNIRTQFWVREIMQVLQLDNPRSIASIYSDVSTFEHPKDDRKSGIAFWDNVKAFAPDKNSAFKAYELVIEKPIDAQNWANYFDGSSYTSGKSSNIFDAFSLLIPTSKDVFNEGKYKILSIIESDNVKDAIDLFADATSNIYREIGMNYADFTRIGGEQEFIRSKDHVKKNGVFEEEFLLFSNTGQFQAAFNIYGRLIPSLTNNNLKKLIHNDFLILDFAKKIIEAKFFSNYMPLAIEFNIDKTFDGFSFCLNHLSEKYLIKKSYWLNSFTFNDHVQRYWEINKDRLLISQPINS